MATLLYGSPSPDALGGTTSSPSTADETLPLPIHAPASRLPVSDEQVLSAETKTAPFFAPVPPPATEAALSAREPMASSGGPDSGIRPRARRDPEALTAIVVGLAWTAAIWLGLALLMIGFAYPVSFAARVTLMMLGSWLVAVGTSFAITARPATA